MNLFKAEMRSKKTLQPEKTLQPKKAVLDVKGEDPTSQPEKIVLNVYREDADWLSINTPQVFSQAQKDLELQLSSQYKKC